MRRITGDFRPLLPGLEIEFLQPEAFAARVRGRPILIRNEPDANVPPSSPIHSFIKSTRILVNREVLAERLDGETRELRRLLVEGLILDEILYLALARESEFFTRTRSRAILRRYWPLQYFAVHGTPLQRRNETSGVADKLIR